MKQSYSIKALAAGVLFTALQAKAEDLTTVIEVDRTIVPIEAEASPLETVMPHILQPSIQNKSLNLTEYGMAAQFAPKSSATEAPVVSAITPHDSRGYIAAGYFPVYNLGATAGYRFIDNKNTALGINLNYLGNNVKFNDRQNMQYGSAMSEIKMREKLNIFDARIYFGHTFTTGWLLGLDVNYMHSSSDLASNLSDGSYSSMSQTSINDMKCAIGLRRRSDRFFAAFKAGFQYFGNGKTAASGPFGEYSFSLSEASDFARPDNAKEYLYSLDVSLGAPDCLSTGSTLAIDLQAEFLRDNAPSVSDIFLYNKPLQGNTRGIFHVNPYWDLALGNTFSSHIGLMANIATGSANSTFHIAPDINFAWTPSGRFAIGIKATGGEKFNTFANLYQITPFFAQDHALNNSYTPYDVRLNANIKPIEGLEIEVRSRIAQTKRAATFGGETYSAVGSAMPLIYRTCFSTTDLKGWSFGGKIAYAYRNYGQIAAQIDFYPAKAGEGFADIYDHARRIASFDLSLKPIEKLNIAASYSIRSHRSAIETFLGPDGATEISSRKLASLDLLDIKASYSINRQLNVFLALENMLGKTDTFAPFYTTPGFHGMAGVALKL